MTKEPVTAILDRNRTRPLERQADIARVVELMEEQDNSSYQLTDEQLAEVRRRCANPSEQRIPLEEAFSRYRSPDP